MWVACHGGSTAPSPGSPGPLAPSVQVTSERISPAPSLHPSTPENPSHLDAKPLEEVTPLAVCGSHNHKPLDAARGAYDRNEFEEALSCSAEACAVNPDDPDAHAERAAALSALNRTEDAKLAYARALALDPDHLDALLGAAHLYGVSLPSNRDNDELAALYAERGRRLAHARKDRPAENEFDLLLAMTFNDLGDAKQALARSARVLAHEAHNWDARYERAVALFELCRFHDAQAAFTQLLQDREHRAHAEHHLGLLLEREQKWKDADAHFVKARELSPADFPPTPAMSGPEFKKVVADAVKNLPADMQHDLEGVPVAAEDLPRDDDLLSGDPPLSPTILGLFRGPPLSEACEDADESPCRSVVLYRRNLARAVDSRAELLEQVRVTLLHEVGHLRGEDDLELAARGLE